MLAGAAVRGQGTPAWSSLGTNIGGAVNSVVGVEAIPGLGGPAYVAVAGGGSQGHVLLNRVALWDGWTWRYLGSGVGGKGTEVNCLASPPFGSVPIGLSLFAGGAFATAGGEPANRMAQWTSGEWSELGGGADGAVLAMFWCETPLLGPALFVGGPFFSVGNAQIAGLARWDGAQWSSVGSGLGPWILGNQVYALAFTMYDDDGPGPRAPALYVGGRFKYAGGVEVRNIGRWDGTAWSALGSGSASTSVEALCVFDPDGAGPMGESLFAGGPGLNAGGLQTNGLARWDGTTWHTVPGWVGNSPLALTAFDDDGPGPNKPALYVGGFNISAGGLPLNRIAKWDGQQWFSVGGGITQSAFATPEVRTLGVFDEDGAGPNPGGLYVGGFFTQVGGTVAVNAIARWGCPLPPRCDANCNRDFHPVTGLPILTVADFGCFQTRFVLKDPYGDCNEDGELTVADFGCFQTRFVTGCP